MAEKEPHGVSGRMDNEVPGGNEFFAAPQTPQPSERDIFASSGDIFGKLSGFEELLGPTKSSSMGLLQLASAWYKRFPTIQKVLVVNVTLIIVVLVYGLLKSPSGPAAESVPTTAEQPAPMTTQAPAPPPARADTPVPDATVQAQPKVAEPPPASVISAGPLSLQTAETLYLQRDFDKAYAVYDQLRRALRRDTRDDPIQDFLQLKMAFCATRSGDAECANRLFIALLRSSSPVVRVVAAYNLCLAEMQKQRFSNAAARAYQVLALIEAIDYDRDWVLLLQHDCRFLVAEAITRNIQALNDADKDLPPQLWTHRHYLDPFGGTNEAELHRLLDSGTEQLGKALLYPQINKLDRGDPTPRWTVTCNAASIGELVARFAAHANLDIHWGSDGVAAKDEADQTIRKRPVTMHLSSTTSEQFVAVAAGSVGLRAQIEGGKTITIIEPSNYSSLSAHVNMLARDAISLWRGFLITSHADERIPNAHFALGLLQAQTGRLPDAIAEYKLVANRFSKTSSAPYALFHSSKLKAQLHDYAGARSDLKQLVEQYPDLDFSEDALLNLADATMKAGLPQEAARLYRKVYNLSLSRQSQMTAALRVARYFYDNGNYETAAKWLVRYLSINPDRTSRDFYSASILLGKANSALGNYQQAHDAFLYALSGNLSSEDYVEAIAALVRTRVMQGQPVDALQILENTHSWQFSLKESVDILILKASVLRSMGLADNAVALLGDRAQYMPNPQLKAEIFFEMARCHIARGDLELAQKNLAEILVLVEPGPLAHEAGCELADVSLKLGQDTQAISICSQILDSDPPQTIRDRASKLLAAALVRQKDYDRAARALIGPTPDMNSESDSRNLSVEDQTSGENRRNEDS